MQRALEANGMDDIFVEKAAVSRVEWFCFSTMLSRLVYMWFRSRPPTPSHTSKIRRFKYWFRWSYSWLPQMLFVCLEHKTRGRHCKRIDNLTKCWVPVKQSLTTCKMIWVHFDFFRLISLLSYSNKRKADAWLLVSAGFLPSLVILECYTI